MREDNFRKADAQNGLLSTSVKQTNCLLLGTSPLLERLETLFVYVVLIPG